MRDCVTICTAASQIRCGAGFVKTQRMRPLPKIAGPSGTLNRSITTSAMMATAMITKTDIM